MFPPTKWNKFFYMPRVIALSKVEMQKIKISMAQWDEQKWVGT